jgi:molybdopterin-guanine dinucleotide biosynthesis protein A
MAPIADTATISAVVLAGGLSRRFGQEKGLAEWRGLPVVEYVLQRLPRPRRGTLLVMRAEQEADWTPREGVQIINDHEAHAGPLRGVVRALDHVALTHLADWAWVVACDQPLVSAGLLVALAAKASPAALAVIPEWDGRLQPLSGLYHVDAAARLRECHDRGEASLIGALETIGYQLMPAEECRHHDLRGLGFMSINRPSELAELERMLA